MQGLGDQVPLGERGSRSRLHSKVRETDLVCSLPSLVPPPWCCPGHCAVGNTMSLRGVLRRHAGPG